MTKDCYSARKERRPIDGLTFEVLFTPGLEHEPEFEGVRLPATLDGFVTGIVADVVELILLKEVRGRRGVGLVQHPVVPSYEDGGLQWSADHLVWIPSKGICQLTALRVNVQKSKSQHCQYKWIPSNDSCADST